MDHWGCSTQGLFKLLFRFRFYIGCPRSFFLAEVGPKFFIVLFSVQSCELFWNIACLKKTLKWVLHFIKAPTLYKLCDQSLDLMFLCLRIFNWESIENIVSCMSDCISEFQVHSTKFLLMAVLVSIYMSQTYLVHMFAVVKMMKNYIETWNLSQEMFLIYKLCR